jgi:hypothetical protein
MFNILERRFNIFDFRFKDIYLFVLFMIVEWCLLSCLRLFLEEYFVDGFAQTIFLEMVFRRIEFWIEGDRGAQIRLSRNGMQRKSERRVLNGLFFINIFWYC